MLFFFFFSRPLFHSTCISLLRGLAVEKPFSSETIYANAVGNVAKVCKEAQKNLISPGDIYGTRCFLNECLRPYLQLKLRDNWYTPSRPVRTHNTLLQLAFVSGLFTLGSTIYISPVYFRGTAEMLFTIYHTIDAILIRPPRTRLCSTHLFLSKVYVNNSIKPNGKYTRAVVNVYVPVSIWIHI